MQVNIHNTTDNQFTEYNDTSVVIKNNRYHENILMTNELVQTFAVKNIIDLTFDDLAEVIAFNPDLIIFGTGTKIMYPDLRILQKLHAQGIGVEVMPIQALCRTFNFLVSESRKVACILFF